MILRSCSPLLGSRNLCFTVQNHSLSCKFQQLLWRKSTDFPARKCHLLYVVVALESLRRAWPRIFSESFLLLHDPPPSCVCARTLTFLSPCCFLDRKENHQNNKDSISLLNPHNTWERREKLSKKLQILLPFLQMQDPGAHP